MASVLPWSTTPNWCILTILFLNSNGVVQRLISFLHQPQAYRRGYLSRCYLVLSLLFTVPVSGAEAAESQAITPVYYPGKLRQDYYTDLLHLALSYPCATQYAVQPSDLDLPKKRAFDLMNAGQGIDVMYGSASNERINTYRAIPFPILRGLMGLRIALVSSAEPNILKNAHSLAALSRLRVGQFISWSDTAILRANDFNVEAASTLESLYQMLDKGRIDYFPRSVLEIQQNQAEHAELNLQIDPHILLYYPTATYYYVAKDNNALADALLCGLEHAQQSGQLNQLFERYYGDVLQQLNVAGRRVIKLQNPLLPAGVPLLRPEMWYPLPDNSASKQ